MWVWNEFEIGQCVRLPITQLQQKAVWFPPVFQLSLMPLQQESSNALQVLPSVYYPGEYAKSELENVESFHGHAQGVMDVIPSPAIAHGNGNLPTSAGG